jgi:hypothetical protein
MTQWGLVGSMTSVTVLCADTQNPDNLKIVALKIIWVSQNFRQQLEKP